MQWHTQIGKNDFDVLVNRKIAKRTNGSYHSNVYCIYTDIGACTKMIAKINERTRILVECVWATLRQSIQMSFVLRLMLTLFSKIHM